MLTALSCRHARAFWLGTAALLLTLLGPGVAGAQIVRLVDEDGVIHLTNDPCTPRYTRLAGALCRPAPTPDSQTQVKVTGAVGTGSGLAAFDTVVEQAALDHGVDARLVRAVIQVESGGNPRAVSPKGAAGLMQLMPVQAARLGVRDVFDPGANVAGGTRYLADLIRRYGGDLSLALAAYNAGEEAVRQYGGVPPYAETRAYVRKVLAAYGGPAPAAPAARPPRTSRTPP